MKQTLLGVFFLLIGAAVITAALLSKPIAIPLLLIGVAVAVFGAFLVPSSNAGPALNQIVVTLAPYLPRIGGSRPGDPPPPT